MKYLITLSFYIIGLLTLQTADNIKNYQSDDKKPTENPLECTIPNINQECIYVYLNGEIHGSFHVNEANAIEHALLLFQRYPLSEIYYVKKVRFEIQ